MLNKYITLAFCCFFTIYVIEASVPMIIFFCVKSAKMVMIYINGRRFGPVAFISAKKATKKKKWRFCYTLVLCMCT